MRSPKPLDATVEAIERARYLDPAVTATKKVVDAALPSATVRDALHGVWFGHPLHPALIVIPLGSWLSASLLDLMPGRKDASRTLVGLGVLAAVPTAAAGAADWAELLPRQQRTGLLHALANTTTLALQYVSWRSRRQGRHARGAAYSLAALGVGSTAAYLGGHLAYRQAAGVNHAEEASHVLPQDWSRLCSLVELPDGKPNRLTLDGAPVFVLRRDRQVDVLYDRCSHLAGPLSGGELSGQGDETCITCPWHGSTFRLRDGQVRRGPAISAQPVLRVRVETDGSVLVRSGEDE